MKKNIYKLIFSFAALALVTSCEDDDSSIATVPFSPVDVTLSVDDNNVTIMESAIEDMVTYTVTASIAEPQVVDMTIFLGQTGGTAENHFDFDHDEYILISAGSTSATGAINIYQTGDVEGDDTLTITASTEDQYANLGDFAFNATIVDDYINKTIDLEITWAGEVVIEGEGSTVTAELCAVDIDFKYFSEDLSTDYGYLMATGDCPESTSMEFEDGVYVIASELYANPHAGFGDTTDIPMTVSFEHEYFNSGSVTASGIYDLSMDSGLFGVAKLIVSNEGTTYELLPFE